MAHTDPRNSGLNHEQTDVDLSGANRFIVIMALFLALSFALVYVVFTNWRADYIAAEPQPSPVAVRDGDRLPPLPRLQTTPYVDLKAFTASEDEVLTTYAWVDKEKGVVRLPIARAIELVAERGLPAAAPAPAQAPAGTPATP
jgi:hypothetical protein